MGRRRARDLEPVGAALHEPVELHGGHAAAAGARGIEHRFAVGDIFRKQFERDRGSGVEGLECDPVVGGRLRGQREGVVDRLLAEKRLADDRAHGGKALGLVGRRQIGQGRNLGVEADRLRLRAAGRREQELEFVNRGHAVALDFDVVVGQGVEIREVERDDAR